MEIELTHGKIALIDDCDAVLVLGHKWSTKWSAYQNKKRVWYAATNVPAPEKKNKQRMVLMHRLIMQAQRGEQVDHRNGDGLDNRRQNLRKCSNAQNARNRRRASSASGFKGVNKVSDGKFRARIMLSGSNKHLGYFSTAAEAAAAYDEAAVAMFGQFAATNQELGMLQ